MHDDLDAVKIDFYSCQDCSRQTRGDPSGEECDAQLSESSRASAYHHGDLRKALLEAAEAELAEKGVEGFTLRGCAKRAGVSHAAPAHHFKDANALAHRIGGCRRASAFTTAWNDRQARAEKTPRAQFIASGIGYVDSRSPTRRCSG